MCLHAAVMSGRMNENKENRVISATCTAPVNIAVIKYWGKRDEKLILPINSSLSATLHQDQLCAKTTVAACRSFTKDRMWLNGEEQSVDTARLQNVFREMRARCAKRKHADDEDEGNLRDWKIHICSENNFPTAAGLASSAAGYACLVFTLSKLYGVQGDISEIARQGSGSACRSVMGGFVAWNMGSKPDGKDSLAEQIAAAEHWPEMRILVLVVNTGKKHTGSTAGMQTSVETSELLQERIRQVPRKMDEMSKAISDKNYQQFSELTMKDSNQMHAVCLDTYPPISYMTDTSRDIQRLCHGVNVHFKENRVAYTYDAGPNACLYLLEKDVPLIFSLVKHFYPTEEKIESFVRGPEVQNVDLSQDLIQSINIPVKPDAIKYVIHTKVGPGPQVLNSPEHSLLNAEGLPKTLQS